MDELLKQIANGTSLAGWLVALTVIATGGIAWIKLMREMGADQEKRITQKDGELATLRHEKAELEAKVKFLSEKSAGLENRVVEQGAIIYGKLRYIRRLEKMLIVLGKELPPKNGPGSDLR